MGGGGVVINDPQEKLRLYHKMRGLIIKWGEGAIIFIFLLLPEMVNTLTLLLKLMCFLSEKTFKSE